MSPCSNGSYVKYPNMELKGIANSSKMDKIAELCALANHYPAHAPSSLRGIIMIGMCNFLTEMGSATKCKLNSY